MSTEEEQPIEETSEQDSAIESESVVDAVFSDSANSDSANHDLANHDSDCAEPTIESLQTQLADAEKRVLLAHADLENFRRRNRREMQDQLRYASLGLMNDVMESVDNLRRAVESYEKDASGDGLVEGVKLVAQQIDTLLQNNGCKRIEAVGQPFDPNLHQALQMQPSEEFDANVVMMELRPGFQLHDRVIRPSQVFVSTGPEGK